jgi:hypothetical protein
MLLSKTFLWANIRGRIGCEGSAGMAPTLDNAESGLDGGGCVGDGGVQLLAARLALQPRLHALQLPQPGPHPRRHGRQQPLFLIVKCPYPHFHKGL